jgi:hypothetical protein
MKRDEVCDGEEELMKEGAAELLQLQEDGAGNLYWRGRRLTPADYGKLALAAMLIGAVCNLVRTGLDLGRTAGWW